MMVYIKDTYNNEIFKLNVTKEQKKLLDWLFEQDIISSSDIYMAESEEALGICTVTL